MLKDITLGQYFPINSIIHKLDARIKILAVIIYVIAIFFAENPFSYVFVGAFTLFVIALSKVPIKLILKSLKPLIFIIVFTSVINILLTDGTLVNINGYVLKWGFIKITYEGIFTALKMAFRLIFLVMGTSLLTFTTSPISLTDGIEKLLSPFKKIGVPAHELAMMMTIAIRFIPTLIEETDKIMKAQKARGADFESGNLISRVKAMIPILVPLFISSFRRADELAIAMEARCYHGGEGRTRMKELKIKTRDILSLFVMILFPALIILINIFL
ncbi:MAG: energy-coupling factor transporter transmembrane protein EcfT [Ruminococcaceae bacterium]|nr:energy-coupling factor transporter transmembrane protein EcfT [Oscillospiraceae bacterium]